MTDWNASLPQEFLIGSYQETEPDLVLSFKTDFGPPLTRRRGVGTIRIFSGEMDLTTSQKATLRSFWEDYCASNFNCPDPFGGADLNVIFMAPPQYSDTGAFSGGQQMWKVKLQLAELP